MTKRPRVLIVDDVEGLRTLVRIVLEDDGRFEVVGEASNGLVAVELAEELQPDLVLLDLAMPVMDGLEALPRIINACPGVAVLVLSGFAETKLLDTSQALGARGYIEKGVRPEELVAAITRAIDQARPAGTDASVPR